MIVKYLNKVMAQEVIDDCTKMSSNDKFIFYTGHTYCGDRLFAVKEIKSDQLIASTVSNDICLSLDAEVETFQEIISKFD